MTDLTLRTLQKAGSRAPRKTTIRNMAYYSKFAFQPGPRNGLALNPSSTIPCLPYPRASRKDIQVWSWWMVESGRSPAAGLKVPQRGGEGVALLCAEVLKWPFPQVAVCAPPVHRELRALCSLAAGYLEREHVLSTSPAQLVHLCPLPLGNRHSSGPAFGRHSGFTQSPVFSY